MLALGEERLVNDDQTTRFGSVRYSTSPGHAGRRVRCRVHGAELVIVARDRSGLAEIARHLLSAPGNPQIRDIWSDRRRVTRSCPFGMVP